MQSQEVKEDTILCGTLEVMPIPKQGGLMILRVGYLLYKPATSLLLGKRLKRLDGFTVHLEKPDFYDNSHKSNLYHGKRFQPAPQYLGYNNRT